MIERPVGPGRQACEPPVAGRRSGARARELPADRRPLSNAAPDADAQSIVASPALFAAVERVAGAMCSARSGVGV